MKSLWSVSFADQKYNVCKCQCLSWLQKRILKCFKCNDYSHSVLDFKIIKIYKCITFLVTFFGSF